MGSELVDQLEALFVLAPVAPACDHVAWWRQQIRTIIDDANDDKASVSGRDTADMIAGAIMGLLNTLHLLNGLDGYDPGDGPVVHVPFADNITEAVKRFDKPELRQELVRRLYAEPPVQIGWAWRYADITKPFHDPNWHYVDGLERPTYPAPVADLSEGHHTQLVPVYADAAAVAERKADRVIASGVVTD